MATKSVKTVAKKKKSEAPAKEDPKILAHPPKETHQNRVEFGSENHAMRTIAWAVGLGIVPKSVATDAAAANHKSELVEALERVKAACTAHDYAEQAKRVDEIVAKLKRSPE